MPLNVSSTCAHRQEAKIVLYSLWYRQTLQVAVRCTGRERTLSRQCACPFYSSHASFFGKSSHQPGLSAPIYSQDLASCDFWLFQKLKSPLKQKRFVNAKVIQYIISANGVSLPTDQPHGIVTVQGCSVKSPLTGCQVTSRPRNRLSRYSKWLDTFRKALVTT